MVIGFPIKCDTCGKYIMLKIQCDNSLHNYEFPLHVYCKECGDEFECVFSSGKGILPMKHKAPDDAEPNFTLYYSPQLPIPTSHYYQESKPIGLTPYMVLGLSYNSALIAKHGSRIQMVLDNVYPYRKILLELIPVMRKGNFNAFQKKMMNVFGIKQATKSITSVTECRDIFAEFIEKILVNFASWEYIGAIANKVVNRCNHSIDKHSKAELISFEQSLNQTVIISRWVKDVEDFMGQFVNVSEKYYPAMFFANVGDFKVPHALEYVIETINVDDVHNYYKKSFDLLNTILPLFVGLCNWEETGDYNIFPNASGGMKGISSIEQFSKLPDGLKLDKLQDYQIIKDYLADCYNIHVRNGLAHDKTEYEPFTQKIEYYYKMNDNQTHEDYLLIDVCYMTFINVLHLMEMYLVVHQLKTKIS